MFRKNRSSDVYFATITGNAMRCDAIYKTFYGNQATR